MRRTQLYLEDDLWQALQLRARQSGATMSALVRKAIRDVYIGAATDRKAAMAGIIGLWKDRDDIGPIGKYIRQLRKGSRRKQMFGR